MAIRRQPRFVRNPLPDYGVFLAEQRTSEDGDPPAYTSTPIYMEHVDKIRTWLISNCQVIERRWPPESLASPLSNPSLQHDHNFSIYTGAGGNAYLHWKLSRWWEAERDEGKSDEHLLKALQAIETSLSLCKDKDCSRISFYAGGAGNYALAAILYHSYKETVKVKQYLKLVTSLLPTALDEKAPDELLYGRAGYLSCLLLLKKHLPVDLCHQVELDQAMRKVFSVLLLSGQGGKQGQPKKTQYLQYYFHGKDYLGAAHGTMGILYLLLQFSEWCLEPQVSPWIRQTLDHLLSIQFKSGNFPSKDSNTRGDELVHWCHGAPGAVNLLHRAYEVYKDNKYLTSMETALTCIWEQGLLGKGFCLCHGIAGNGYAFLTLFSSTKRDEYYYYAMMMGQCIFNKDIQQKVDTYADPQRFTVGVADHPYSLMEGLAGTICFYCDLLHPELAAFPGYAGEF